MGLDTIRGTCRIRRPQCWSVRDRLPRPRPRRARRAAGLAGRRRRPRRSPRRAGGRLDLDRRDRRLRLGLRLRRRDRRRRRCADGRQPRGGRGLGCRRRLVRLVADPAGQGRPERRHRQHLRQRRAHRPGDHRHPRRGVRRRPGPRRRSPPPGSTPARTCPSRPVPRST
ncbi:hypothetical protein [Nocardioides convexus]|uniref:hypothetical protein n=1 Tax=Nocardioides convexus TaxID=2712224 RepID=UPI002418595F|nr:hypothetical protein [Nocardioides convexus]